MSNLKNRLAMMNKEAINFCPDCKSIMKIPKGSKDNIEYCSNPNCEKSFEFEKQQRKEERERRRDERINITYKNGDVGDSVLMKFINTNNGKEYWSAFQRKPKNPDSWVEDAIDKHLYWLKTDDKRLPPEMRDDYKSGDNFIHEEEIMKDNGAFDTANAALPGLKAENKAYHTMIKSPKNQDPIYDNLIDEDELLVPMASLKRLIKKIASHFNYICNDCGYEFTDIECNAMGSPEDECPECGSNDLRDGEDDY